MCGSTHWFPPPRNRTVDIFVPSAWFDAGAPIDAPVMPATGSPPPSKIVTCDPLDGVVQFSIWGSASGRNRDVEVREVEVRVDGNTITVEITPDPTRS